MEIMYRKHSLEFLCSAKLASGNLTRHVLEYDYDSNVADEHGPVNYVYDTFFNTMQGAV